MEHFFEKFFSTEPQPNDPAAYPKFVEIQDADVALYVEGIMSRQGVIREKTRAIQRLNEDVAVLQSEIMIASVAVFRRLEELYPDVYEPGNCGYRRHDDKLWFVGGNPNSHTQRD